MNRFSLLLGLVLGLLGLEMGCLGEAPHDNPFDPAADTFTEEGSVTGQVLTRAGGFLPDVEVRLLPVSSQGQAEFVARTDSQGRFAFGGVPAGSTYRLEVSKMGYASAEVPAIDVLPGTPEVLPPLALNALPAFTSIQLSSIHISRWWPEEDLFFLDVRARLDDLDGPLDIATVTLEIPSLNVEMTLEGQAAGLFEQRVELSQLPTASMQELLGRAFRLSARDGGGAGIDSGPQHLVRVIDATPVAVSPRSLELLTSNRPEVRWEPFGQTFAFSYRIDVHRDVADRVVVAQTLAGISRDVTSARLGEALATGQYFWTVTVVDAFGNESRSKEAGFRVP